MRKINEIFYSLQGEGEYSGEAAIFVRFSGCNLKCPFCDTRHQAGQQMSDEQICEEVEKYPAKLVVLTGGEPSLWIDEELVEMLQQRGKYVAIETNGTHPLPSNLNHITLSPKSGMTEGGDKIVIPYADEIKVVNVGQDLEQYFNMPQRREWTRMSLQPCYVEDDEDRKCNIIDTVAKVKKDPRWRFSAQLHRFLDIP